MEHSVTEMGTNIQVGFYNMLDDQFVNLEEKFGTIEIRTSTFANRIESMDQNQTYSRTREYEPLGLEYCSVQAA